MKKPLASSFLQLLFYMRPFRRIYLSATLYSFLNKLFDLMPEILLGIAVNTVVAREQSWLANLGFCDLKTQLILLGLMTMVAYGLESLSEYLFSIRWWNLAQIVQHNFRMQAFEHVQKSTITSFSKQKTGNLLSILNDDINQLERFLEEGIDKIIEVIGTSIFVGGIFFFLAPQIAIFVVIPIPIIIYSTFRFQKKLSPYYLNIREKAGLVGAFLANSLLGLLATKSLVAEQLEKKKLEKASMAYKDASFNAIRWGALLVPIIRFVILSGILVTLIYGGKLTIEQKLDVGVYSILIFLTQRLLWPFTEIADIMINFQRVMASTQRLLNLFELPTEDSPNNIVPIKGRITFDDVSFSYHNHTPSLHNLTFATEPGQHIAFVGATGAGKSTLLHLLLGFYLPTSGKIFFDNKEIRELSLPGLRKQLGFVSQEPFLFEGTIAENISYGYAEATPEQIIEAAKNAAAHEFIMRLPEGYDTIIGERGQNLSGGQKQRLAIARAIVRNPAILILDEATSSVDNATELAIQRSLSKIGQGRTMILIAHRLSMVKHADKIFVLKKGSIAEQGTHEELLQHDNVYANLWKLQMGETLTHPELIID
ncbi:MAG: ABC transporter ATP-binding protein [Candidatus Amoebophilus sp.]